MPVFSVERTVQELFFFCFSCMIVIKTATITAIVPI